MSALLLSIVVSPVYAQQTLENPQPDSFQSGIGVISGWACKAQTIEISFNGGPRLRAALGTIRADTQGVCGDTDNGFGLLYNWNLLGDGVHTVTAYADGVEFASVTVIVTTLGEEFRHGASGTVPLTDFPTPGETRTLRWQQAQQNFVITAGRSQGGGTSGAAPHILENPQLGSFQSGVGVISGWTCDAQTIEISFDSGPRLQAGVGTLRADTAQVCGDTDNGFGLLYNWNLLGDGLHTVTAYADGVEFAQATVTVATLGTEFWRGLSREVTIPDFPEVGTDTVLTWQEAQQNFVIASAATTQRLVQMTPTLKLPAGVSIPHVEISSLYADGAEIPASPEPSLLLAVDPDGTVLLAIADQDGGLLGEAQGTVEVSVDSAAVTLIGLMAGIAVSDMTQSVVDAIQVHAHYPSLVAAMSTQLAADKNFLDRLYAFPDIVNTIREVAASLPGPVASNRHAPGQAQRQAARYKAPRQSSILASILQALADIPRSAQAQASGTNDPDCAHKRALTLEKLGLAAIDLIHPVKDVRQAGEALRDVPSFREAFKACAERERKKWKDANPGQEVPPLPEWEVQPGKNIPEDFGDIGEHHQAMRWQSKVKWKCTGGAFPESYGEAIKKFANLVANAVLGKVIKAAKAGDKFFSWLGTIIEGLLKKGEYDEIREELEALEREGCTCEVNAAGECVEDEEEVNAPPVFEQASYTFTLLENRGNVTLGAVRASDPDGREKITYSLVSGGYGEMYVDPQTGVVRYLGEGANYETRRIKPYHITVRATESGEDGLSTEVRVTVDIEDEDEPPYFREERYDFTERVTHPRFIGNVPIGTVQAQDPEKTAVHYSLVRGDAARFSVSSDGRVTYCCYNDPLPGGEATHSLLVRATDSGGAGLSTDIQVKVRLVGGNRPPVFTAASYSFTLGENVAGPKALGTVVARDPDVGDTVTYRLSTGDRARFTVDTSTGVVGYIGTGEDYGEQANFTLEVVATDAAGLSANVLVNVRLIEDDPYQLIYCRRDRDVEIEGSDSGWTGRSSWHCIDTELKHERPELLTPYRVCNEYNETHAYLRGPDAMLMEVIGEYQDLAHCFEDIPVEKSCIGSHQGFCGYWGGWD